MKALKWSVLWHSLEPEELALERHWGVGVCAGCGKTMVLGEGIARAHDGHRSATLCSSCAAKPAAEPELRAAGGCCVVASCTGDSDELVEAA